MQRRGLIVVALACLLGACSTDSGVSSTMAGSMVSTVTEPSVPAVAPTTTATSSIPGSSDPQPGDGGGLGDELFPDPGFAGIDVQHYDVDLTYDPGAYSIAGAVGTHPGFSAPLRPHAPRSPRLPHPPRQSHGAPDPP